MTQHGADIPVQSSYWASSSDEGRTHIGDKDDATSLENMKNALEQMKQLNEYRTTDYNRKGLKPLGTDSGMMAYAMINANMESAIIDHWVAVPEDGSALDTLYLRRTYAPGGENASWGYSNEVGKGYATHVDGWMSERKYYDFTEHYYKDHPQPEPEDYANQEDYNNARTAYHNEFVKAAQDANVYPYTSGGTAGHYALIINPYAKAMGMGVNNRGSYGTTGTFDAFYPDEPDGEEGAPVYTIDQYYDEFMAYYNSIVNADEIKANAKTALDNAEAALATAKTTYSTRETEKTNADNNLTTAQNAYNTAKAAQDAADQNVASKQADKDAADQAVTDAQANAAAKAQAVNDAQAALADANADVTAKQKALTDAQAAVTAKAAAVTSAETTVQDARDAIANAQANAVVARQRANAAKDVYDPLQTEANSLAEAKQTAETAEKNAQTKHDGAEADKNTAQSEFDKSSETYESAKTAFASADQAVTDTEAKIADIKNLIADGDKQLEAAKQKTAESLAAKNTADQKVDETSAALKNATDDLGNKQMAYDDAVADQKEKQAAYDKASADAGLLHNALTSAQTKLNTVISAENKVASTKAALEKANEKVESSRQAAEDAKTAADKAGKELAAAREKSDRASKLKYAGADSEYIFDPDFAYLNEFVANYVAASNDKGAAEAALKKAETEQAAAEKAYNEAVEKADEAKAALEKELVRYNEIVKPITYKALNGAEGEHVLGSSDALSIEINAEIGTFECVMVDGTPVDSSNYTVTEGSTIITFSADYLNTLAVGKHEVTALFSDGISQNYITILEKKADADKKPASKSPDTADNNGMFAYFITFTAGTLGAMYLTLKRRKENA